jgi:hypothetical protein
MSVPPLPLGQYLRGLEGCEARALRKSDGVRHKAGRVVRDSKCIPDEKHTTTVHQRDLRVLQVGGLTLLHWMTLSTRVSGGRQRRRLPPFD